MSFPSIAKHVNFCWNTIRSLSDFIFHREKHISSWRVDNPRCLPCFWGQSKRSAYSAALICRVISLSSTLSASSTNSEFYLLRCAVPFQLVSSLSFWHMPSPVHLGVSPNGGGYFFRSLTIFVGRVVMAKYSLGILMLIVSLSGLTEFTAMQTVVPWLHPVSLSVRAPVPRASMNLPTLDVPHVSSAMHW